jgi:hypothetical protein
MKEHELYAPCSPVMDIFNATPHWYHFALSQAKGEDIQRTPTPTPKSKPKPKPNPIDPGNIQLLPSKLTGD